MQHSKTERNKACNGCGVGYVISPWVVLVLFIVERVFEACFVAIWGRSSSAALL